MAQHQRTLLCPRWAYLLVRTRDPAQTPLYRGRAKQLAVAVEASIPAFPRASCGRGREGPQTEAGLRSGLLPNRICRWKDHSLPSGRQGWIAVLRACVAMLREAHPPLQAQTHEQGVRSKGRNCTG